MKLRLGATLSKSRANGPGARFTVWFQGCSRGCPGCANPDFQSFAGGGGRSVDALLNEILTVPKLDGVTLSGGEPFDQPDALFALVGAIRARTRLSVFVFSGYEYSELDRRFRIGSRPDRPDAILCGPFREELAPDYDRFLPSANQELRILTDRFRASEFSGLPVWEETIRPDGSVFRSGILRRSITDRAHESGDHV